jgi:hypothetical protein
MTVPTKADREILDAYFSMRSHGIALVRKAEKELKKRKIVFVASLKDEFLNRKTGES